MNYQFYLGIDIGKFSFDYTLIDTEGTIHIQAQVENNEASIKAWLIELQQKFPTINLWEQLLICMEHSGYYNAILMRCLQTRKGSSIWVESALQIKRSIGIQRGKNDKIDALRIAVYALDFQRKARLWKPKTKNLERLELLLSHRDRLVRNLMSIGNTLQEEEGFIDSELHEDIELSEQAKIVKSIPVFGNVIASIIIIIATHGFTRLTNPRALAFYAGVAPFEHRSGTSIKGKTRVSHYANKDLKRMIHLAALVTI